jgi:ESCRT-II complex subunit VPS22
MDYGGYGGGLAALMQERAREAKVAQVSHTLAADRTKHITDTMALFRDKLQDFAAKHRDDINRDPEFRRQFVMMCKNCGVDPLASNKGFWAEMLGMGDFYYELCVQVADICIATRGTNGGLIALDSLVDRLRKLRKGVAISDDDVKRAIDKLGQLGGGYEIVQLGPLKYVRSVPDKLRSDATLILRRCAESGKGYTTEVELIGALGWEPTRARRALADMLKDGMAWLDAGAGRGEAHRYYVPSIYFSGPVAGSDGRGRGGAAAEVAARGNGGGGGSGGSAAAASSSSSGGAAAAAARGGSGGGTPSGYYSPSY